MLMRSPSCLCVSTLVTFQPISRFFNEIQQGGHATEDDLEAAAVNPVASNIPNWRTFELLRRMQNFQQSTWDHNILCADSSSEDEQLTIRPLFFGGGGGKRIWWEVES
jgi:hypothetical protein